MANKSAFTSAEHVKEGNDMEKNQNGKSHRETGL